MKAKLFVVLGKPKPENPLNGAGAAALLAAVAVGLNAKVPVNVEGGAKDNGAGTVLSAATLAASAGKAMGAELGAAGTGKANALVVEPKAVDGPAESNESDFVSTKDATVVPLTFSRVFELEPLQLLLLLLPPLSVVLTAAPEPAPNFALSSSAYRM